MAESNEELLQQGAKFDKHKERWDLLPMSAIKATVQVLTFGAHKYKDWNWAKGINYSRVYGAAQRHLNAWWEEGEELDPETGIHHLAHLSCCVLFLLTYRLRRVKYEDFDDRPCVHLFTPTSREEE